MRRIFDKLPWIEYGSYIAQILTPIVGATGLWFVVKQIKVSQTQSKAAIKAAEAAEEETIEIIGHEYLHPVALPMNPYSSSDVWVYGQIEGERTVRDIPVFRILHLDKSKLEVRGKIIEGNEFTRDVSIVLDTYSFPWDGFPIYRVPFESKGVHRFEFPICRKRITIEL